MRLPHLLICFAAAALLGGCAYQGTIVEKRAEPSPFYHSVGIDGSYSFLLRDNTGTVRRQIVTPDVYALYDIGEYFNDLQPRQDGPSGGKQVLTAGVRRSAPLATSSLAKVRKPANLSVAMLSKSSKPRPAAIAKRATAQKKVAAKPVRKTAAPVRRIARPAPKAAPAPARVQQAQPILRALPADTRVGLVFSAPRCR